MVMLRDSPPERRRPASGRLFWIAGLAVGIAGGAAAAVLLSEAASAGGPRLVSGN